MATFLLFQDIFYIEHHSKALHMNGFVRMAPLQPNNTASCECFQMLAKKTPLTTDLSFFVINDPEAPSLE